MTCQHNTLYHGYFRLFFGRWDVVAQYLVSCHKNWLSSHNWWNWRPRKFQVKCLNSHMSLTISSKQSLMLNVLNGCHYYHLPHCCMSSELNGSLFWFCLSTRSNLFQKLAVLEGSRRGACCVWCHFIFPVWPKAFVGICSHIVGVAVSHGTILWG